MITKKGIKPHPKKVQTIINMEAPKTLKDFQRLNGGTTTLSRFILRCTDKCQHFFKLLKIGEWSTIYDKAFREFKMELARLLTLQAPKEGETLTMYIATFDFTMNVVLAIGKEQQNLVFFHSKVLQGAEAIYEPLEKLAFTIISAARRLRPYFQAHAIDILTSYPLLQTLHKTKHFGKTDKVVY